MAEDVIIRYKAEVDQLTAALKKIEVEQHKITDLEKEGNASVEKSINAQTFAAKKRKELLAQEQKALKTLQEQRKLAFTTKDIEEFNRQISKTTNNIDLLKGTTADVGLSIKSLAAAAAVGIGAAFSVDKIIEFGKASIDEFLKAEESANRLKFAITSIGGEGEQSFKRLIEQSEKLSKNTLFNEKDIQGAQALLSSFDLTSAQIELLIPKLADYATIVGTDISTAANRAGSALLGSAVSFKKFGVEVSASNSVTQNFDNLLSGLTKTSGAAAKELDTVGGKLQKVKVIGEEIKKGFGEKLIETFTFLGNILSDTFSQLFESIKEFFSVIKSGGASIDVFKNILTALASPINIVAKGVGIVVEGITLLARTINATGEVVKVVFKNIGDVVSNTGVGIANILKGIKDFDYKEITTGAKVIKSSYVKAASDVSGAWIKGFNAIESKSKETASVIIDEQNRILNAIEIQTRSDENLIKLKNELSEINTNAARQNIDAIDKELERREKLNKKIKDDSDKRIAGSDKEIKKIQSLGAEYNALYELINNKDKAKLFELQILAKLDPEQFKAEVAKLAGEVAKDVTIPIKLEPRVIDEKFNDGLNNIKDKSEATNQQILESSSQLFSELSSLYSTVTDFKIAEIERAKEAELKSIDDALSANEKALEKGRITEVEAQQNREKLLAKRAAAEKKAADEERKLKRKQAILDKTAALFQIAINTARAISEVSPVVPLMALAAFVGAAEAALVAAQPIPYKKGTKSAKGGLSLVGEEGPELTMLPTGSKVLPAKQTKTHSEAIDAMFDNRYDSFVLERYVNPALVRAKKEKVVEENKTFAENITNSFVMNSQGLSEASLEKIRRKGQTITNADEIGRAVAQAMKQDPYRR